MNPPAVETDKVTRRFGRRWALQGVSFAVPQSTVQVIGGHNGSGKSTLLRLIATAIRPNGGTARVVGFDVVRQREDVRRATALVTHQTYLYEALTARENLTIAADYLGSRDGLEGLLDRVGLLSREHDPVNTFSAGMRKRLMIARLLLQKPQVALFDEPYGQLDTAGFELFDKIVGELRAAGAAVVIATHQLERTRGYADGAVILREGRVAWQGKAADAPDSFSPC
ncbi:MAG TPA: heme ABC exporter ATP-binding protein CcmA [Thermoanaerobaculia bacterium]|nr:heme ABC exporter ATP-binding protein CcmA [Thermoanaerobaculia bacterium]